MTFTSFQLTNFSDELNALNKMIEKRKVKGQFLETGKK